MGISGNPNQQQIWMRPPLGILRNGHRTICQKRSNTILVYTDKQRVMFGCILQLPTRQCGRYAISQSVGGMSFTSKLYYLLDFFARFHRRDWEKVTQTLA